VVIHYLYIVCVSVLPFEADTVSIIDPNAMLALAVMFQSFQTVCRRNAKLVEFLNAVQPCELPIAHRSKFCRDAAAFASVPEKFGICVLEALDHVLTITTDVIYCQPL
jgi:hypothetical protein